MRKRWIKRIDERDQGKRMKQRRKLCMIQPHEFANIFPLLSDNALALLAEDIRVHGQKETIKIFEGKILDGRNRFAGCIKAGIVPQTKEFTGSRKDALDYVLSLNLHRRQMDESQRAMSAARFLKHSKSSTIPQASDIFNVSESSIGSATRVINTGHPSLIKDVECGNFSVSLAKNIAALDQHEQDNLFQSSDITGRIKVARAMPKPEARQRLFPQKPNISINITEQELKVSQAIYNAKCRFGAKYINKQDLTIEDLKPFPTHCPITEQELDYFTKGTPTDNTFSLDRLDPKKPYRRGNVKILSVRGNRIKNDGTLKEFKNLIKYMEE